MRKINSGNLEITTKVGCPLNCRACPQSLFITRYGQKRPWESEAPKQRPLLLSFADFKTCVDKLPPDTTIDFSAWGEPCQNPAFADMVLYASSAGRQLSLFSTLVGMSLESYERIRGVPWKGVVLHIPDEQGDSHFILSDEYLALLDLVLGDVAAGHFKVTGYSCHGSVHPVIRALFQKHAIPTPASSHLHDRAGNVKQEGLETHLHQSGHLDCMRHLNHNVLLPDGTVCLCCMDFGMDYILGNLLVHSYRQIMKGEVIRNLRERMKSPKHGDCICRHCPLAWSGNAFEYAIRRIRMTVGLRTRLKRLWSRITQRD